MQLFVASLNSGSNGNCYYVGNEREAVLIDAGISCRETERRMKKIGLSMQRVKAIFVSHEHSDHINGIPVLAKKYNLPVYITQATLQSSRLRYDTVEFRNFSAAEPIVIGQLSVQPFQKWHDAADAHSFTVTCAGYTVGVFTDIGAPCDNLIQHFASCHAAILEANYDDDLLEKGRYPYYLKQRIRSNHGHLSNAQALDLFLSYKPDFMSHLLLGHLSRDNNRPELVQSLFEQHAGQTKIVVASRYEPSAVFSVSMAEQVSATLW